MYIAGPSRIWEAGQGKDGDIAGGSRMGKQLGPGKARDIACQSR